MSTPTHARTAAPTTAAPTTAVPRPRPAAEPPAPPAPTVAGPEPQRTDEPAGIFTRYAWLVPATAIASVIAVFVAMVLITWAAGGATPFDR
jgi:hypothetical protein